MRHKPQRWIPKDSEKFEHPDGLGVAYMQPYKNGVQLIAYGGKRNNADFNYLYKTREAAVAKIEEWFKSLTASAEFKTKMHEERKNQKPDPYHLDTTEVASMVRGILKQAFPNTKFSVRSDKYSMGSSVDVHWTDGPTTAQVQPICDRFAGSGFDGMQDLKYSLEPVEINGRAVRMGTDYVFANRHISRDLMKQAALRIADETGLPLLFIDERGCPANAEEHVPWSYCRREDVIAHDSHGGEWYSQLINQVAMATSCEAGKEYSLPPRITQGYIDDTVHGMLQ